MLMLLLAAACAQPKQDSRLNPSPLIGRAFEADATARVEGRPAQLSVVSIGDLDVPSGRIVACDPFICDQMQPFTRKVPTGRFPVQLAITRAPSGDQRVAFARILFSDRPAKRWELALPPGESLDGSQTNYAFGYGVDTGTGSFMDAAVYGPYMAAIAHKSSVDQLVAALNAAPDVPRTWLLRPFGPGNVAMYSSGFGDGYYMSFFGLDEAGQVVSLTTDFSVID
jgi:hypothetical protein